MFSRRRWEKWLQGFPWSLHRHAHWGLWVILSAAVVLGVMVWVGWLSLADAEHRLLIWVAIAVVPYFISLGWHVLRSPRGDK
jgi:hypothetical protein